MTVLVPPPPPKPAIDVAALIAEATRWVVPYIVAFVVAVAAKVNFHWSASDAYTYVTGVVGTALTFVAHWLEAKFPGLNRILVAKRPASLTK